jgi:hypothetical protein
MTEAAAVSRFFAVIAEGQEGLWAACARPDLAKGRVRWLASGDELAALVLERPGRLDYFVPAPFASRRRNYASLAAATNVARLDLDPPDDLTPEQQAAFVDERLASLEAKVGEAAAVLDSGRGAWAYYKLARAVPRDEARELNRLLQRVSGSSDAGSYNPAQWARCPGSTNVKTGRTAAVLRVDPGRLHDPDALRAALESEAPGRKRSASAPRTRRAAGDYAFPYTDEELEGCELPGVELREVLRRYAELLPSTDECKREFGKSRSEMEQSVFNELCRRDWSDLQVHAFAHKSGLPKYAREFGRGSDWAEITIASAREFVEQERVALAGDPPNDELVRETSPPLAGGGEEGPRRPHRRHPHPRWVVLKEVDGSRPGEVYSRAARALAGYQGTTKRSLQAHVARLIEDGDVVRVQGDDGVDRLVRTATGDEAAVGRFVPFRFVSYLLSEEGRAKRLLGIERQREDSALARAARPRGEPSPEVSYSAAVRRRARHIYRTDLDGRLRIDFSGRPQITYLQLLSPVEEIVTVLLHHQLHVGWDEQGYPRYANAISPLELGSPTDPVVERGVRPWECTIGVGARLREEGGLFSLDEAVSAHGEIRHAVGFVLEDTGRFWYQLVKVVTEPTGRVLRVRRHGPWNNRSFSFEDLGPGPVIPASSVPSLDAYLEEIASVARLHDILGSIPEHRPLKHHIR